MWISIDKLKTNTQTTILTKILIVHRLSLYNLQTYIRLSSTGITHDYSPTTFHPHFWPGKVNEHPQVKGSMMDFLPVTFPNEFTNCPTLRRVTSIRKILCFRARSSLGHGVSVSLAHLHLCCIKTRAREDPCSLCTLRPSFPLARGLTDNSPTREITTIDEVDRLATE